MQRQNSQKLKFFRGLFFLIAMLYGAPLGLVIAQEFSTDQIFMQRFQETQSRLEAAKIQDAQTKVFDPSSGQQFVEKLNYREQQAAKVAEQARLDQIRFFEEEYGKMQERSSHFLAEQQAKNEKRAQRLGLSKAQYTDEVLVKQKEFEDYLGHQALAEKKKSVPYYEVQRPELFKQPNRMEEERARLTAVYKDKQKQFNEYLEYINRIEAKKKSQNSQPERGADIEPVEITYDKYVRYNQEKSEQLSDYQRQLNENKLRHTQLKIAHQNEYAHNNQMHQQTNQQREDDKFRKRLAERQASFQEYLTKQNKNQLAQQKEQSIKRKITLQGKPDEKFMVQEEAKQQQLSQHREARKKALAAADEAQRKNYSEYVNNFRRHQEQYKELHAKRTAETRRKNIPLKEYNNPPLNMAAPAAVTKPNAETAQTQNAETASTEMTN